MGLNNAQQFYLEHAEYLINLPSNLKNMIV
jgi:hypothetical protein